MVKRLRLRITLISIAALSIVLVILCTALTLVLRFNYNNTADSTLKFISENMELFEQNSLLPKDTFEDYEGEGDLTFYIGFGSLITADTAEESRFFTVTLDRDGKTVDSDISRISDISEDKAEIMARKVFKERRERGNYDLFRFLKIKEDNGNTQIIFLNCASFLRPVHFAQFVCIFLSVIIAAAMTVIVWMFSKKGCRSVS